ncbi:endonuclease MutS2 [Carboxydothermus ferrireducens]|uniref:Endonuclease MutS2 n=1 Tax=Carboxydothermus ferrireducens DSM 11255 TaxID=1119529 RepID=A0ABX2REP5_9THEO|nr:endonuclease MutS2 [Carboxydothermus ferrireducens]NYE58330.1 DNA mismatch repair protein MutS2 [Carboxydothermus ferrireducens DSM 11255]
MNQKTLEKIEFPDIINKLWQKAESFPGKQLALKVRPLSDSKIIEEKLLEVEEGLSYLRFKTVDLSVLSDFSEIFLKLSKESMLTGQEIYRLGQLLKVSKDTFFEISRGAFPRLKQIVKLLFFDEALVKDIERSFWPEGTVKDEASPELKRVRGQIARLKDKMREAVEKYLKDPELAKYLQEPLISVRGERFVLPVKASYKSQVPGIIHDRSNTGQTLFIEPYSAVEAGNELKTLELQEKEIIEKILKDFTQRLACNLTEIKRTYELLGEIDLIVAKARLALELDAYKPRITENGVLSLKQARHPLLGKKAVPFDLTLGKEFDLLIITGPNTGGKTVTLKTIGILTIMARAGLFIPASPETEIGLFGEVYVDIGDEQSIVQSLSTFSSHLLNLKFILENAREGDLVLLDELGTGTDPREGAALAKAILEELRGKKVKVVATTHTSELAAYAVQTERVENASVEFDPESLKPTYRLHIGKPGRSNALYIAQGLGLKEQIIEKAKSFLKEEELKLDKLIFDVEQEKRQLEKAKEEVANLLISLKEKEAKLNDELENLEKTKEEIIRKYREKYQQKLLEIERKGKLVIEEIKEKIKTYEEKNLAKLLEEARQKTKEFSQNFALPFEPIKPYRPKVGETVELVEVGQKAEVLAVGENYAIVQAGIMKLNVSFDQIRPAQKQEKENEKGQVKKAGLELTKKQNFNLELDIRGMNTLEAEPVVEKYLDNAYLAGVEKVRIIHGKGTGALKKFLWDYLREVPFVKKFNFAPQNQGGDGATEVYLK